MTNIRSIEVRPSEWFQGSVFLSWADANSNVREIARRVVPIRGPHSYTATATWEDGVTMAVTFDVDNGHAVDPAPLSTELYDGLFASTGYDFGPAPAEGHA